jgi:hypothetical protein
MTDDRVAEDVLAADAPASDRPDSDRPDSGQADSDQPDSDQPARDQADSDQPARDQADSDQAGGGDDLSVARSFVQAIAWGEHHTIWDLLSTEGRKAVLRIAVTRGMDEGLAARMREGTAARHERDGFLQDLVNGLRTDLVGNDLDSLRYEPDPDPEADPTRARVILVAPVPELLAARGGLPVGSIELTRQAGAWRVERLLPRAGR